MRITQAAVALSAVGYLLSGCGARTGDELFGDGSGGSSASGGFGATGGIGASGGSGATGGFGGTPFGGGGFGGTPFGGGGFGGTPFGGGGFGGGGFGGTPFGGGGFGGTPFGGGGMGGAPGDCCVAHGYPGCSVPYIASCVCAQDPYCCQQQWDSLCASEVSSLGCGNCGGGGTGGVPFGGGGMGGIPIGGTGGTANCGGVPCPPKQVPNTPITLPGCCPPFGPFVCGLDTSPISQFVPLPNGCVQKNQPGTIDPTCPSQATPQGPSLPGCCKPSGICGTWYGLIDLGCVETWQYGGPPPMKCGGGTGGMGGSAGFGGFGGFGGVAGFGGSGGGGGFTGDCCTTQNWPGCGDPSVWQCVCPKDPYCCNNNWDGICVNEVTQLGCGKCGGSGGSGGVAGNGGSGGFGGVPLCNPQFCPSPGPLQACCMTPNGPCGVITPSGCQPFSFGGAGGQ
ncbi:MAG: hypothetical protein KJ015_32630 [Myxococcales bacterium]|nr:hypothetical protein [Myxococcales bacterium]